MTAKTAELAALMEAAAELARLTGAVALQHFRRGVAVHLKPDGSPVTEADRRAERAARDWIEERFSADGILGEELGERPGSSGRRWLLDPIDGTKTFIRGVPLWGSLVAVLEGDQVTAGAASFPAVDEHLVAAPGQGCWHNGTRCNVSSVSVLRESAVLTTDPNEFSGGRRSAWERLAGEAGLVRTWGDCYGYLLVATGRAEVMIDPRMNPWDAACLLPIVEEAGGRITDWAGRVTAFGGSTIATNGALAEVVREQLRSE